MLARSLAALLDCRQWKLALVDLMPTVRSVDGFRMLLYEGFTLVRGARSVGQMGHDDVEVSSKPSNMTRTEWDFHGIQASCSTSSHERQMEAFVCRRRLPSEFWGWSSEIAVVLLRHLCGVEKTIIAAAGTKI